MDPAIPFRIESELLEMGVIPTATLTETEIFEEPKIPRNYEFRWPDFDENGEPDF